MADNSTGTRKDGTHGQAGMTARQKAQQRLEIQRQLERFIDELIEKRLFKTRSEVARACGMKEQLLAMVLSGRYPERRLTIGQCLRLAQSIQESAAKILRLAGRPEDAAVVDDLWSPAKAFPVNRSERELITQWRLISYDDRHHVNGIVEILARKARADSDGHALNVRVEPPRLGRPRRSSLERASS